MDDEFEPQSQTKAEAELDRLRDWLRKSHWNFSLGRNSFDGFSEGVCVLGGIEPRGGHADSLEYGPRFLPGGLYRYWRGTTPPRHDERSQLQCSVQEILDDYRALGLKGHVPVQAAILAADKSGLTIPWLKDANEDLECARRLPPKLRTDNAICKQIQHEASVKAGQAKGGPGSATQFLDDYVRPIFILMKERGFDDALKIKSSKRPNARAIADRLYGQVTGSRELRDPQQQIAVQNAREFLSRHRGALPQFSTFLSRVREWQGAQKS